MSIFSFNFHKEEKIQTNVVNNDCEKGEQLLLQIHEQFASNNNSLLSSIITLFVALIAVLGAYGYVILDYLKIAAVDSKLESTVAVNNKLEPVYSNWLSLVFITLSVLVVLLIMFLICCYQGYHMRKEQYTVDKIRQYMKLEQCKCKDNGLVVSWSSKGKNWWNYSLGLYGFLAKIIICVQIIITVTSCIIPNWIELKDEFPILPVIIGGPLSIAVSLGVWTYFYFKYKKL